MLGSRTCCSLASFQLLHIWQIHISGRYKHNQVHRYPRPKHANYRKRNVTHPIWSRTVRVAVFVLQFTDPLRQATKEANMSTVLNILYFLLRTNKICTWVYHKRMVYNESTNLNKNKFESQFPRFSAPPSFSQADTACAELPVTCHGKFA